MKAFLLALGLQAAAAQYDANTGKACRDASGTQCSNAGCQNNFWVLTEMNTVAKCQAVCDILDMSCTGFEINPTDQRCEIWKKTIDSVVTASAWSCYNKTAMGTDDGDLNLWFSAMASGLNYTAVMATSMTSQMMAANAIKAAMATAFSTINGVTITAAHVFLNFTDTEMMVGITNTGNPKTAPLQMYRVLRDASQADGISTIISDLSTQLAAAKTVLSGAGLLNDASATLAVTIKANSRTLSTAVPTDDFMDTTTTMMSMDDTTTPNQQTVNAAYRGCGALLVFLLAGLSMR